MTTETPVVTALLKFLNGPACPQVSVAYRLQASTPMVNVRGAGKHAPDIIGQLSADHGGKCMMVEVKYLGRRGKHKEREAEQLKRIIACLEAGGFGCIVEATRETASQAWRSEFGLWRVAPNTLLKCYQCELKELSQ